MWFINNKTTTTKLLKCSFWKRTKNFEKDWKHRIENWGYLHTFKLNVPKNLYHFQHLTKNHFSALFCSSWVPPRSWLVKFIPIVWLTILDVQSVLWSIQEKKSQKVTRDWMFTPKEWHKELRKRLREGKDQIMQKLGRIRIMNGCMEKFEIKPRCIEKAN